MQNDDQYDEFDDDIEFVSKTSVKKECLAMQDLGVALTELKAEELAKIPLDDTLLNAIEESHNIKKHGAKKRHFQFIGKLMRAADYDEILAAYEGLQAAKHADARRLHVIEMWRDRLLDNNDSEAMSEFFNACPTADRQLIRQLTKNAQTEKTKNKPPTSARKLFKVIRENFSEADAQ